MWKDIQTFLSLGWRWGKGLAKIFCGHKIPNTVEKRNSIKSTIKFCFCRMTVKKSHTCFVIHITPGFPHFSSSHQKSLVLNQSRKNNQSTTHWAVCKGLFIYNKNAELMQAEHVCCTMLREWQTFTGDYTPVPHAHSSCAQLNIKTRTQHTAGAPNAHSRLQTEAHKERAGAKNEGRIGKQWQVLLPLTKESFLSYTQDTSCLWKQCMCGSQTGHTSHGKTGASAKASFQGIGITLNNCWYTLQQT